MATQPMFDTIHDQIEYEACRQLGVGDEHKLVKIIAAVPVDLEDRIEQIDKQSDLDDDEKWDQLQEYLQSPPLAWLPKGMSLVTMRHKHAPRGQTDATGFIRNSAAPEPEFTDQAWQAMVAALEKRGFKDSRNDMGKEDFEALFRAARAHPAQEAE